MGVKQELIGGNRYVDHKSRPIRRLNQLGTNYGLGAGQAIANTGILYEIVPVRGQSVITVRMKTAGAGGTLAVLYVGPDFNAAQGDILFTQLAGTIYTTGQPATVAVAAGTEAILQSAPEGENFAIVKFTGGGTGTVTYCDVAFQDHPTILFAP